MLDEIPVLKPSCKCKMMAVQPTVIESLPFIDTHISFKPFVNYLQAKINSVSASKERLYNYLVKRFEEEPRLLTPINDMRLIDANADLMELLSTSLFPVVGDEENNFALAAPYQFKVFYYSESFRHLFFDSKEEYLLLPDGIPTEELKAIQCASIYDHVLEKYYGMHLNEDRQLIYPVADSKTGMMRYYRIKYDRRFIDIHLKGKLPPLQDCGVCMNTFRILDLEKQLATMPLSLFRAEGFGTWIAEDVTTIESLEIIKKLLLRENCGTDIIEELKTAIKAFVGLYNIDIGIMPFVSINGNVVLDHQTAEHSIAIRQWLNEKEDDVHSFNSYVKFLEENSAPTPVSNLTPHMFDFAPFMRYIYDNSSRSYLSYPIRNGDGLIGLLELSSPLPQSITHETIIQLEPAIPLLSLAVLKCRDDFENRVEKVIKEKFTALQESVEWKFTEVAWDHLRHNGKVSGTKNVVFDNVYPLYGAIDIRNSSLERLHAIHKDFKQHLKLIADVLSKLQTIMSLPLLEGLEFQNESIRHDIEETMSADDEIRINEFLDTEVEPLFVHLQKTNEQAAVIINEYFRMVTATDCKLYQHRREYDESITAINNAVLSYIETEQSAIQKSYPHYFEKYRTDGIEYNIYIGQSISPSKPFDVLYLKNIRLWQLKTMAGAAVLTEKLLASLKVPLQTTQLILVHSLPIAISFRRDEKKFDVEGSYNIRYEVVKKRLDKVHIKDTNERLTQPGKIAIVYSNQKDVGEYEEYIRFLQKKSVLKASTEMLELEDLQGVKGLKAIRVEINLQSIDI
jgi:GAF domain-containing protein